MAKGGKGKRFVFRFESREKRAKSKPAERKLKANAKRATRKLGSQGHGHLHRMGKAAKMGGKRAVENRYESAPGKKSGPKAKDVNSPVASADVHRIVRQAEEARLIGKQAGSLGSNSQAALANQDKRSERSQAAGLEKRGPSSQSEEARLLGKRDLSSQSEEASKDVVLETSTDRLYKMVMERGSVTIREAAQEFGVDERLAEYWGRILEEHKMIKMHYPAFGQVSLMRPEAVEAKAGKARQAKRAEQDGLVEATRSQGNAGPGKKKKAAVFVLLLAAIFFLLWAFVPGFKSLVSNIQASIGLNPNAPLPNFQELVTGNYLLPAAIIVIAALFILGARKKRKQAVGPESKMEKLKQAVGPKSGGKDSKQVPGPESKMKKQKQAGGQGRKRGK